MHHNLQQGSITAVLFNEFIEQLTQITSYDGEARTILFDNARAHLQAEQMILPNNTFIRRIPPYSPFLNIVENCFAQWKAAVKRQLAEIWDEQLTLPHQQQMANLAQLAEQNVNVVTVAKCVACLLYTSPSPRD